MKGWFRVFYDRGSITINFPSSRTSKEEALAVVQFMVHIGYLLTTTVALWRLWNLGKDSTSMTVTLKHLFVGATTPPI